MILTMGFNKERLKKSTYINIYFTKGEFTANKENGKAVAHAYLMCI